ncbi:MAG: type II toxin-antitoxin system HicB family antitoxin [Tannerella sp.]|nr:type II toxin-antitoxin system HicB family antitoxin [Tannerella sp.]
MPVIAQDSFNIRLTPDLHKQLAIAASVNGQSLSQYINSILQRAFVSG